MTNKVYLFVRAVYTCVLLLFLSGCVFKKNRSFFNSIKKDKDLEECVCVDETSYNYNEMDSDICVLPLVKDISYQSSDFIKIYRYKIRSKKKTLYYILKNHFENRGFICVDAICDTGQATFYFKNPFKNIILDVIEDSDAVFFVKQIVLYEEI